MGVILENSFSLNDTERGNIKKVFFDTKNFNESVKAVIKDIKKLEEIQREIKKSNEKFSLRDMRRKKLC